MSDRQSHTFEIRDPESIKPGKLGPHGIKRGERVLFKTRNTASCWQSDDFVEGFVYISEAARHLAAQQVQTASVDYPLGSGFFKDGAQTHQALLVEGIWIIEGLNLSKVEPGIFELMCLPLKIEGSDGAPSRAILRFVEAIEHGEATLMVAQGGSYAY